MQWCLKSPKQQKERGRKREREGRLEGTVDISNMSPRLGVLSGHVLPRLGAGD